jgi:hypothetical protein
MTDKPKRIELLIDGSPTSCVPAADYDRLMKEIGRIEYVRAQEATKLREQLTLARRLLADISMLNGRKAPLVSGPIDEFLSVPMP